MRTRRPLTALCKRHNITLGELAERLSRPRDTIKKWDPPPAEAVPDIIRAFGGAVQAHELRPDIFPDRTAA